jgi:hypothetical protein
MMPGDRDSRDAFVIPQKRAGKRFREIATSKRIERTSLETASGEPLVDVPIKVNLGRIVPRVFRLPMQAAVTVISILARIFGFRIVFELDEE